jgi:ribosomal protein S15P/S13E
MKRPYLSDDFSDQIKAYTIAENNTVISQINIQDTKDVTQAAEKIYSLMEEINRHLEHYNINVTDYTCSAELSILIKEEKRQIKFYQKNISVIENLLFTNMQ